MNAISQRYPKCNVYGITISKEQLKYAKKNITLINYTIITVTIEI